MLRYIAQRLAESAVVLLIMSFVIYALIGLMPGDPIDIMVSGDPNLTPEDAKRLRALYGLDRPIGERYLSWLGAAVQGDLGFSRLYARPVLEVLWPRLGNTVILMGASFALAFAIALPAGMAAALKPGAPRDTAINLTRLRRHFPAALLAGDPADHSLRGDSGLAAGRRAWARPARAHGSKPSS